MPSDLQHTSTECALARQVRLTYLYALGYGLWVACNTASTQAPLQRQDLCRNYPAYDELDRFTSTNVITLIIGLYIHHYHHFH